MDIVVAHNFYQQPGGEDHCVAAEIALLQAHGHNVIPFSVHNDKIKTMNTLDIGLKTIWSVQSFSEMRQLFRRHRPRVAHFHNTFPLISPAAYYAARAEGVAVVQTLHNFRILCGNGVFYRDGQVCEACLGRPVAWPGIAKGCYHNSRSATAAVAAMSAIHWAVGTWTRSVDRYIALTEFGREKFIKGGLPADRIDVKPNFVLSELRPRRAFRQICRLYRSPLRGERHRDAAGRMAAPGWSDTLEDRRRWAIGPFGNGSRRTESCYRVVGQQIPG